MPAKKALFRGFVWLLYACAILQFVRYYVVSTTFYLNMPRYLSGHERLPFQYRILPVYLMWPLNHSAFVMHHLAHPSNGFDAPSAATTETVAFYLLALVAFSIAAWLVHRLYRAVTLTGSLGLLVFPVFMVLTLWTYVVHVDANFSYPYDFPSLAFFAGGLLAIYQRRFAPLLLVIFIGTFNRETTLFLIGIYLLDGASREIPASVARDLGRSLSVRERFDFRRAPWTRAALLCAVWLAVKLPLAYHYRHNDRLEDFVRLWDNIGRMKPRLWPTMLNICGYTLPIILLLRKRLLPVRFSNYLYILPLWFAVMFYTGVILETRVYGELCTFSAVAVVLLLEEHVRGLARPAEYGSARRESPVPMNTPVHVPEEVYAAPGAF